MNKPTDFDLLLTNGILVDGSGNDPVKGDIAFKDGRIAAIGDLSGSRAGQSLDCAGLNIAPGFIDTHTHSDAYILLEPAAPSKTWQGVTTEILGHCGASAAPYSIPECLSSDWRTFEYPGSWGSMGEYRDLLESRGFGPNLVALAGHRNLRIAVMGVESRPATRAEIKQMADLLAESFAEGASGFSTGLIYEPSKNATPEEVEALARVTREHGGVYTTHIRNESSRLLEALDEAIDIARQTGVALQISHLKTAGRANWHFVEEAVAKINAARAAGLRVYADRYPYTASGTTLGILLPNWAKKDGHEAILNRLRDPATRARIVAEMDGINNAEQRGEIIVAATWSDQTHPFRGQSLYKAAAQLGMTAVEACLWILEQDKLLTSAFYVSMSEDNLRYIYSQPWVMLGSDGSIRNTTGLLSQDHPHPRAYGANARLLAMSREEGGLSLAETVRRMSSLPAEAFGIDERGWLKTGYWADVVVFNAATVRDRATFAEPHQLSEGVEHVFVNGQAILQDSALTGKLPGKWVQSKIIQE